MNELKPHRAATMLEIYEHCRRTGQTFDIDLDAPLSRRCVLDGPTAVDRAQMRREKRRLRNLQDAHQRKKITR